MDNNKLQLNPNMFFLLKNGKIIVWDYLNHNQYELDDDTFKKLKQTSAGNIEELDLKELQEAQLVTDNPYTFEWGWDELSKIYHIGCKDIGTDEVLSPDQFVENLKEKDSKYQTKEEPCLNIKGTRIDLPQPFAKKLPQMDLWELMKQRMTSRRFNGKEIPLEIMVDILYTGFGRTHDSWKELKEEGIATRGVYRKAHPSGGGLHPLECYVIVESVAGLQKGIYHYNWYDHYLTRLDNDLEKELDYYFYDQFYCKGIGFGVVICSCYEKVWDKYSHSRGCEDVKLDVGHCSQSMLLMATLHEVLTWETAWFRDSGLSRLLGIKQESISPSFFIGIGYGEKNSLPLKFVTSLKEK